MKKIKKQNSENYKNGYFYVFSKKIERSGKKCMKDEKKEMHF